MQQTLWQPIEISISGTEELGNAVLELQLPTSNPVIVIIGGATDLSPEAAEVFRRRLMHDIVPLASHFRATVVDGGTDAGVMSIVGKVFSELAPECRIVGVVPAGPVAPRFSPNCGAAVDPEPNHDIIRVPGNNWGDECPYLIGLVERLSDRSRILVIVVGGGSGTRTEFEGCVLRKWPVLVLSGTGGFADQISAIVEANAEQDDRWVAPTPKPARWSPSYWALTHKRLRARRNKRAELSQDPSETEQTINHERPRPSTHLAIQTSSSKGHQQEAIRRSDFATHSLFPYLTAMPAESLKLSRVVAWRLSSDQLLKSAWGRAAFFDRAASAAQPIFKRMRNWALALGVVTAIIAVTSQTDAVTALVPLDSSFRDDLFTFALVASSGSAAVLVALSTKRNRDRRWISLRSAAESVQREIYMFRARSGPYGGERPTAQETFARRLAVIEHEVARSIPGFIGPEERFLWPSAQVWDLPGDADNLLDGIDLDSYLQNRLDNQLTYFSGKSMRDDRKAARVLLLTSLVGLLSALVAVSGSNNALPFLAVIATIGSSATAWLAFDQTEQRIRKMSETSAKLRAIRGAWLAHVAHSPASSHNSIAADAILRVEETLAEENGEWRRDLLRAQEMFTSIGLSGSSQK